MTSVNDGDVDEKLATTARGPKKKRKKKTTSASLLPRPSALRTAAVKSSETTPSSPEVRHPRPYDRKTDRWVTETLSATRIPAAMTTSSPALLSRDERSPSPEFRLVSDVETPPPSPTFRVAPPSVGDDSLFHPVVMERLEREASFRSLEAERRASKSSSVVAHPTPESIHDGSAVMEVSPIDEEEDDDSDKPRRSPNTSTCSLASSYGEHHHLLDPVDTPARGSCEDLVSSRRKFKSSSHLASADSGSGVGLSGGHRRHLVGGDRWSRNRSFLLRVNETRRRKHKEAWEEKRTPQKYEKPMMTRRERMVCELTNEISETRKIMKMQEREIELLNFKVKEALDGARERELCQAEAEVRKEIAENDKRLIEAHNQHLEDLLRAQRTRLPDSSDDDDDDDAACLTYNTPTLTTPNRNKNNNNNSTASRDVSAVTWCDAEDESPLRRRLDDEFAAAAASGDDYLCMRRSRSFTSSPARRVAFATSSASKRDATSQTDIVLGDVLLPRVIGTKKDEERDDEDEEEDDENGEESGVDVKDHSSFISKEEEEEEKINACEEVIPPTKHNAEVLLDVVETRDLDDITDEDDGEDDLAPVVIVTTDLDEIDPSPEDTVVITTDLDLIAGESEVETEQEVVFLQDTPTSDEARKISSQESSWSLFRLLALAARNRLLRFGLYSVLLTDSILNARPESEQILLALTRIFRSSANCARLKEQ